MARNSNGYRSPIGVFTSKPDLDESLKDCIDRVRKSKNSYYFYALEFVDGVVNTKLTFGIDF
jgi:hypothetical protein